MENFESFSCNNKKNVSLYGDTRFDENKNKFILEAIITYLKNIENSMDPFLNDDSVIKNVRLYTIHLYIKLFSLFFWLTFKFSHKQNIVVGTLLYAFLIYSIFLCT